MLLLIAPQHPRGILRSTFMKWSTSTSTSIPTLCSTTRFSTRVVNTTTTTTPPPARRKPELRLYTREKCSLCEEVYDFLEDMADEQRVCTILSSDIYSK